MTSESQRLVNAIIIDLNTTIDFQKYHLLSTVNPRYKKFLIRAKFRGKSTFGHVILSSDD